MNTDLRTIIREELDALRLQLLSDLQQHLAAQPPSFSPEQYIDNHDFLRIMRIATRTAQKWRTQGLIPYSQIGRKVYYKITDVTAFVEQHYRKAWSDLKKYQANPAH